MFYAAQNFQEHVDEMIRAGMSPKEGPKFTGEKSTTAPYLFLKAPSCLAGANDDIPVPSDVKKVDWEAEIACVITRPAKRVKAEKALDHVAGWMTTNDVSARDLQIRTDRPGLRSDWLNGKSHDKFAPMGPYLVPKAFVKDHMKLFIRLSVNGNVKQNGNTSQFIFTPEEQIEYASNILTPAHRRHLRLRHLRRRRPGHPYLHQRRRRDGDRGRGAGQDAQQVRRGGVKPQLRTAVIPGRAPKRGPPKSQDLRCSERSATGFAETRRLRGVPE